MSANEREPAKDSDVKINSSGTKISKVSKKPSWSLTGFTKTSNLVLFLLTAGIFSAFCAFNFFTSLEDGHWLKPSLPGEKFWFRDGLLKLGMQVHLWSVVRRFFATPIVIRANDFSCRDVTPSAILTHSETEVSLCS